jgi:hypothetical protein
MAKGEKKQDEVDAILALDEPLAARQDEYREQPDRDAPEVKAAIANVRGAISQLKDAIRTESAKKRPAPRTDGGRSEDGSAGGE